jgi:hypothetical protein
MSLENDLDYGVGLQRRQNYNSHLITNTGDGWDGQRCLLCNRRGGVDLSFNVCMGKASPLVPQSLMFSYFTQVNRHRCINSFYGQDKEHDCSDWTLNDWAVALGGETGELMNNLKKIRRGDNDFAIPTPNTFKKGMAVPTDEAREKCLMELADIITYADLMVTMLGSTTAEVLTKKFNEVSLRVNYNATSKVL